MNKQLEVKRNPIAIPALADNWNAFRNQIEEIFDRFSDGFGSVALKPFADLENAWQRNIGGFASLAVDVAEDDKAYTITAELPGVSEKDVDVSVHDGMLVIKGEKRQEKEEKSKDRYVSERSYGAFQRMFSLPAGTDEGKVAAEFHNGILTVTVPKAQSHNVRKVDVKAA